MVCTLYPGFSEQTCRLERSVLQTGRQTSAAILELPADSGWSVAQAVATTTIVRALSQTSGRPTSAIQAAIPKSQLSVETRSTSRLHTQLGFRIARTSLAEPLSTCSRLGLVLPQFQLSRQIRLPDSSVQKKLRLAGYLRSLNSTHSLSTP